MFTKVGYRALVYVFIFIFTIALRWLTAPRLLPQTWTPEYEVRITAYVTEEPYLSGSKYIIPIKGADLVFSSYKDVELGEYIEAVGKVSVKVIGGKQVNIRLYDPSIRVVQSQEVPPMSSVDKLKIQIIRFRSKMVLTLQKYLPEPHASLSAGILLGIRAQMPESFYQALVDTGTLHVIAASGYNVTIVLRIVMGMVLLYMERKAAILAGMFGVFVYVILAGSDAAVVRAALMGIVSYSAYYWGRVADAKRLLYLVSWFMLMWNPLYLVNVGFQLSFSATWGLLYVEPLIRSKLSKQRIASLLENSQLGKYLSETVYPTLAATICTLPVILWWFGRVSFLSPIANIFVLWVVPFIMFLSAVTVGVGLIYQPLAYLSSLFLFLPLEYFVRVIEVMGR